MLKSDEVYCCGCSRFHKSSVMRKVGSKPTCQTCSARIQKSQNREARGVTLKVNHAALAKKTERLILEHSSQTSDFSRWYCMT